MVKDIFRDVCSRVLISENRTETAGFGPQKLLVYVRHGLNIPNEELTIKLFLLVCLLKSSRFFNRFDFMRKLFLYTALLFLMKYIRNTAIYKNPKTPVNHRGYFSSFVRN